MQRFAEDFVSLLRRQVIAGPWKPCLAGFPGVSAERCQANHWKQIAGRGETSWRKYAQV